MLASLFRSKSETFVLYFVKTGALPARSIVGRKEKQTVAFLVITSFIERAATKYLDKNEKYLPKF